MSNIIGLYTISGRGAMGMRIKRNKKIVFNLVVFIALIAFSTSYVNATSLSPVAEEGILSLEGWNFSNQDPLKLKGDWEFYWNELLSPQDLEHTTYPQVNYIHLPHSWNGYVLNGKPLAGKGYATFRLNILLDESMVGQELALKMQNINFSYKLWIDGDLVTEVGNVGSDRTTTTPKITTELIPFYSKDESIELVIQVANFHHQRGGIANHILFGDADQLIKQTSLKVASEMFITGSIISIGIYHLMLFGRRRSDKAPLFFGLFCLIWGVRTLFVGEVILTQIFPEFPFEIELKYEYMAFFIGAHIFAKYIQSMYPDELPDRFCQISRFVSLSFSFVALLTPARIFTHTLLAFEIYTVVYLIVLLIIIFKAALHKREGALLLSVVAIFSFLTVINDFLYYAEKLLIGNLSPLGLFIFTIAQMYILSNRFANAFSRIEEVSVELKETNEELLDLTKTLEDRVKIRTVQLAESNQILQKTNEELIRSQESRRKLLSYITHDLKSPITSIVGYAKAVIDKINPEKFETHLNYIHDKTLQLNQMLNDLSDLSQLENRSFRFQMIDVKIDDYLRRIYEKYELCVTDAGIHFQLDLAKEIEGIVIKMDPDRIEQVLYNLISNSIKFTKSSGTIAIYSQLDIGTEGCPSSIVFKITDTGIGIPQENLPYIFEREFKEYPKELIGQEGSGLGLAICKEIIESHGGRIWAETTMNAGSSLCFTLPLN